MSAKSSKSILTVCLLFSLLLSIFGCITASSDPNRLSVKDLKITVDVNRLEEFRAQLRKFADKHSLTFIESFYNKDDTFFSIEMNGDDFHVFLQNEQDFPGEFSLAFFNEASPPISQQALDELTNDLKGFVMEIPNVAIAERVKSLIITIDKNREQEVLGQLQKFADKHSLDFKLSFSSDKSLFHVEVYGEDFHVISEDRLRLKDQDVEDIFMTFYADINNKTPNPISISQETLDELFNDLKNFLEEIPSATVIEGS
jgi:hypothetical protein